MIRFYGPQPPGLLEKLRPGGICPHCKQGVRYTQSTYHDTSLIIKDKIKAFVIGYTCELCLGSIPIEWKVDNIYNGNINVKEPVIILPVREPYNFEYIPEKISTEIEEALNCLSVGAYNGFAAVCRRTIQAVCTNLGTGASDKVKNQVNAMIEIAALGEEWKELTTQIMLTGHDGAHPHLPEVNSERAAILLSLMQDLPTSLKGG